MKAFAIENLLASVRKLVLTDSLSCFKFYCRISAEQLFRRNDNIQKITRRVRVSTTTKVPNLRLKINSGKYHTAGKETFFSFTSTINTSSKNC